MIIGIDYGVKKIGISYSEGIHASPLCVITNNKRTRLIQVKEAIQDTVNKIVIGMPDSPLREEIAVFANELKSEYNCEIIYTDEFNSTQEAQRQMIDADVSRNKRRNDDARSAVIILNRYLETVGTK